jgi:transcriptional regulator with XRE-family HTH domain
MEVAWMLRLEQERRRHRWSQSELGRRSGVHASSISLIEGRRLVPGPVQLEKLRIALGVRAADAGTLLDEVEMPDAGPEGHVDRVRVARRLAARGREPFL